MTQSQSAHAASEPSLPQAANWIAVFAMTLCVGTLIASEFLPISLLTPIASELNMTEGRVGQAISVSGLFAVLTSLLISQVSRGVNRRALLPFLTLLMMLSGIMVAFAPNAAVFMAGRALIGIVIGGFWSMSTAIVMRLVPGSEVPRALGVLNGGNALATIVAAPLGSFLGQYIGWRGAFFLVVPLGVLTLVALYLSLPSLPSERAGAGGTVFRVLCRQAVPWGMLAITLFFLGQFALYTYLRPFLERVTRIDISTISLFLLLCGLAGLVGSSLIGMLLRTRLYSLLIGIPLLLAGNALALMLFGSLPLVVAGLLCLWGLLSTATPVAWWTWLSKVLPDDAEAGGGLMVAVIQLAITLGAMAGGLLYDTRGYQYTFAFSALVLGVAALATVVAWRSSLK